MSHIRLSIILPAYNADPYIVAALDALTIQLTGAVELLVIDDGSTDTTRHCIDTAFAGYQGAGALTLLAQPNQGVSAARNLGLRTARGDYIGFVDADDLVLPGYIDAILGAMQSGADIVEFGYTTFNDAPDELQAPPRRYTNRRFGLHRAASVQDGVHAIARWYPWSRVCKASLFDGVAFPRGVRVCEDVMTMPLLYEKAATVLNLEAILYGYRNNRASATFNIRPDYIPSLETFYRTIPRTGSRRHDYLRIAIAYSIHSCKRKSGSALHLAPDIADDMRRLRFVPAVYRDIELRKVGVLLFPALVRLARRIAAMPGGIA
jgi:glycosyltransferase involved in cell wall biosynthesis